MAFSLRTSRTYAPRLSFDYEAGTVATVNQLKSGLTVFSINDRPMGSVASVMACCFGVEDANRQIYLRTESVFNVDDFRVTLMCQPADVVRYSCGMHSPTPRRGTL
jgi:hypothetical protein